MEDYLGVLSKALGIICTIIIDVISYALFIRVIMSWFADETNKIYGFLIMMTEPFIAPVRALLSKISQGRGMPIDISVLITYLLLNVVRAMLEMFF